MTHTIPGLSVQYVGEITVVEFTEPRIVDQAQLERLGSRLCELIDSLAVARILIDLDRVESMSSSALGILVEAHNIAEQRGGQLHLANLDPQLSKMLKMTKLHRVLNLHKSTEKAMAQLRQG
jgi:anti-anti-sigma factor